MKKMLFVLAAVATMGLVSCGGKTYDATVLEAKGKIMTMAGQFLTSDDTVVGWDGGTRKADMKAASVKDIADVDTAVADKLAGKNLEYLYLYKGAKIGAGDAGWDATCQINGEKTTRDGSFAVKAILGEIDAESETFDKQQWICHDHDGHTESLTPNTLWVTPSFTEAENEQGFHWDMNPVCIGDKGSYAVIVAKYKEASTETVFGYGMGLVRLGDATFPEAK